MSNVVAIVEQTAEIFVSCARLMIPSLFWQTLGPLLRCLKLCSRAASKKSLAASSIVQTHSACPT
jgi:hypothetical protein